MGYAMMQKKFKTQFEQFYDAFSLSPGGFDYNGTAYLKQSVVEKILGWELILQKLNKEQIIAADEVIVLPDSCYECLLFHDAKIYKIINGKPVEIYSVPVTMVGQ